MSSLEAFYHDTSPWTPPKNCYPTCDNVLRFYMFRIYAPGVGKEGGRCIKSSPDQVIKDLSLYCIGVGESGDGCEIVPALATRLKIVSLTLVVSWATRQRDYLLEGVYIFQNIFICEL